MGAGVVPGAERARWPRGSPSKDLVRDAYRNRFGLVPVMTWFGAGFGLAVPSVAEAVSSPADVWSLPAITGGGGAIGSLIIIFSGGGDESNPVVIASTASILTASRSVVRVAPASAIPIALIRG